MKRFYFIRSSEKRLVKITEENKRWSRSQTFEEDIKFPEIKDDPGSLYNQSFYQTLGISPK